MIVSPKLIVINPSHVFIIFYNCRQTWVGMGTAVCVYEKHCVGSKSVAITDVLIVLPQGDGHVLGLACPALTFLFEPLHEWLQLWGNPLRFERSIPQP